MRPERRSRSGVDGGPKPPPPQNQRTLAERYPHKTARRRQIADPPQRVGLFRQRESRSYSTADRTPISLFRDHRLDRARTAAGCYSNWKSLRQSANEIRRNTRMRQPCEDSLVSRERCEPGVSPGLRDHHGKPSMPSQDRIVAAVRNGCEN